MFRRILSDCMKLSSRAASIVRGGVLKLKVIALGGHCEGLPRVSSSVTWKYPPHEGIRISRGLDIGPGCFFDVPPGGMLTIEEKVKITGNVYISCLNRVEIGRNTLIAEHCSIRDAEHLTSLDKPINQQGLKAGEIIIGEDVWICKGSLILGCAVISSGTILGANSMLKNVETEENCFYVGAPARKIKKRQLC